MYCFKLLLRDDVAIIWREIMKFIDAQAQKWFVNAVIEAGHCWRRGNADGGDFWDEEIYYQGISFQE